MSEWISIVACLIAIVATAIAWYQAKVATKQAKYAKTFADTTIQMTNIDNERCKEERLERKQADLQLTGELTDSGLVLVLTNKGKGPATHVELLYPFKVETRTFALIDSESSITETYNTQDFTYGLARVVWTDEEEKKRKTYELKSNGIDRPIQAIDIKRVT